MNGQSVADYTHDMNLDEAANQLKADSPFDLVAIKIRPIKKLGAFDSGVIEDEDYGEISRFLSQFNRLRGDAKSIVYLLLDGSSFIFARHETGPEIIFLLQTIVFDAKPTGAELSAASEIVDLINAIAETINNGMARRPPGGVSNAQNVQAVSIEKRSKRGARMIRQFEVRAGQPKKAIENFRELIG